MVFARARPFRKDRPSVPELSAGAVVIDRSSGRVLLLHEPKEDRWCLPKGHVDPGETVRDAAERELEEESGLSAAEWGPELAESHYRFYDPRRRANVFKTVVYLIAFATSKSVRLESTFDAYDWLPLRHAVRRVQHESDQEVLRRGLEAGVGKIGARSNRMERKGLGQRPASARRARTRAP